MSNSEIPLAAGHYPPSSRSSDPARRAIELLGKGSFAAAMDRLEIQTTIAQLAEQVERDREDAARYRLWRDKMVAREPLFTKMVARHLPPEVGMNRGPTAAEWDAALSAVILEEVM